MSPRPTVPEASVLGAAVDAVPWFSAVGRPHEDDDTVVRIGDWTEVPGPEEPRTEALHLRTQRWYDALRDAPGDPQFRRWHDRVLDATLAVPGVRDDGDAWDPRSQCRWSAAWVVGLLGLHLTDGRPPPAGLADLWSWFAAGHYPCADADPSAPHRLVVL